MRIGQVCSGYMVSMKDGSLKTVSKCQEFSKRGKSFGYPSNAVCPVQMPFSRALKLEYELISEPCDFRS